MDWAQNKSFTHRSSELRRFYYPLGIISQDRFSRCQKSRFVNKWQYAKFPLYIAIYINILQPLKFLSVGMQKEEHDPILILRRLRDFNWTKTKLDILVKSSLQGSTQRLTNYTNFLLTQRIKASNLNSSNLAARL